MSVVKQSDITDSVRMDAIHEFLFVFTQLDVQEIGLIVAEGFTNAYGVQQRIDNETIVEERTLFPSSSFYGQSIIESIFYDLDTLRTLIHNNMNRVSDQQSHRFSLTTPCVTHTWNYLLRNLDFEPVIFNKTNTVKRNRARGSMTRLRRTFKSHLMRPQPADPSI